MSECDDELMSGAESKGDKEETCEHKLVCAVVAVSRSVSERFSGSFTDAVSVEENWLLKDSLSVVSKSHWPLPNPAIRPSPPLSSEVRPCANLTAAGGWSDVRSEWSRTIGVQGSDPRSECRIQMTGL